MNGTFCIDKRIGYLALFAVPLMVLTVFSLVINSQKVSQSSRAEERNVASLSPTVIPSIIPANEVCFKKKNGGGFVVSNNEVKTNLVTSIYDSQKNLRTILSKGTLNLPTNLTEAFYVGIQGDNTDLDKAIGLCKTL